ncbi:LytR C-terminal domain-containing protein [Micromonospora sp. DT81.3]|uniref:LytR C-terminal domain-containing protein n=1 Tax=Micromonospora sp. DT81.3 TaxID=3416523 RepID=UPI003CF109EB
MPKTTYPRDRFDEVSRQRARVGAHRAENPRMRAWVVVLWALLATIVLVAIGIFGSLIATGRVTLFPAPSATPAPVATIEPVIDLTYGVVVLNATPEPGLATRTKDTIVAAGWPADSVLPGDAGSTDFPETTVYYSFPEDEAAALGLAGVIGGAQVAQTDAYLQVDDPATEVDESVVKQLTVVLGLDRIASPSPSATE